MSLQMVARGQATDILDSLGLPHPTVAKSMRYWFDDDTKIMTCSVNAGVQMLDASMLFDGLHTISYQLVDAEGKASYIASNIFLKMKGIDSSEDITISKLIYWFDDQQETTTVEITDAVQILDISTLPDGLHTIHCVMVFSDGFISSAYSSIFLRMNIDTEATAARSIRYWFDENTDVYTNGVASSIHSIDISELLTGLHTLHYQLIDDKGNICSPVSAIFLKPYDQVVESGENAIIQYDYWLNDKTGEVTKVTLDEYQDPFKLIKLLPISTERIRSSCFHFENKDNQPMMYAKNDIHFRFHDRTGRWVDESKQYVDYNTFLAITDIAELKSNQTFGRPEENGIKWFEFEAAPGDTIAFKASQATSIQVFAPSGKEIFSTMGDKSVQYSGAHTWETGTYYVAVHDVTGSKPSVTLDYMHMDKYDVVSQDVHIVGNGGCSTITFQGNGFKDLYAVDLKDSKGNIIESIDVGHESDATTTVTFDFTGAKLGKYNAVFHFAEEDKNFTNCITVEEAKDIELATKVSYPSTFLRGTSTTYTVTITNKGNMTAYEVPIYAWIKSQEINDITSIKIEGLKTKKIHEYFDTSSMSIEDLNELMTLSNQYTDDLYFNKYKTADSDNLKDTICVRSNYFFANLAPHESRIVTITITSRGNDVQAYITVPEEWPSLQRIANDQGKVKARMFARSEKSGFNYCCIRNQVECILNMSAIGLDVASLVSSNLGLAVADCVVGGLSTMASSFGSTFCGDDDTDFDNKFANAMHNSGMAASVVTSLMSCVSAEMNVLGKWSKLQSILSQIVVLIDAGSSMGNTSCHNFTTSKQPGCPPTPPHGGNSRPINSYDPNEIYGYIAPSGSMYVGDEVLNMPYRIEFENDTTFATSAAHKVVVKDTLDAKVFDLSSYQPTSIKIGDKSVQLKGDKSFVTTVDMRPEINAIAQVEGLYDEKKGIATWQFTSLDPMTMEPTDDIMQGFLPVNYDGSGIGEVAYNINRKTELSDGTAISNKASIVFDSNEAIETPVWTNIIDGVPPTAHVSDLEQVNDTIVRVHFDGDDNRSGVWKYSLYVQYGKDTSWNEVAEMDSTSYDFRFYKDIDYGFCVLATDSAGNVEKKIIEREYSFLNGEATMIDAVTVPREKHSVTNRAYDLSGRLIQEAGHRGIIIKNRKKFLKR